MSERVGKNTTVASITKEDDPRLAKRPLVFDGRLANRMLTCLVTEATIAYFTKEVNQNLA